MLGGHSFDGYAVIDAEHRETQMYSGFEHIIDISQPTFKAAESASRNREISLKR